MFGLDCLGGTGRQTLMAKCRKCIRDDTITLATGDTVCNYCPRWALECEARELLRRPLAIRRDALEARERVRGKRAVDELKAVMRHLFDRGRP
jgi:hypothetical protein